MRITLVGLVFLLCVGCGGGDGSPDGNSDGVAGRAVASLSLEPDSLELRINQTSPLVVTALDADGNAVRGATIAWTSSNERVVDVTPEGVVIARGVGDATVEAAVGDVKASAAVVVTGEAVALVSLEPSGTVSLSIGGVLRLSVLPFDRYHAPIYDPRSMTFASSDESVLTVSAEGVVRAHERGDATVTVVVEGIEATVEFEIVPPVIEDVVLESELTLVPGDEVAMVPIVLWSDNVHPDFEPAISWSIDKPNIATIDAATGVVTANKEGSATVTAVVEGVSYEFPKAVEVVFDFGVVAAGGSHACGLVLDAAFCWGANGAGQLGRDGGTTPGRVDTDLRFKKIAAGGSHTCALTESGEAYCWGDATSGQLGGGTMQPSAAPVLVSAEIQFTTLVAADRHNCGVTLDDELYCWGDGADGRLGTGDMSMQNTPKLVGAYKSVSVGDQHSCALNANGDAFCWGANAQAQLGLESTGGPMASPQAVAGGYRFGSIVTGSSHTCGNTVGGETLCWGANDSGQVGDGTNLPRPQAVLVSNNILPRLSSGPLHTCGLTRQGEVQCWGEGNDGRLGTGDTADALEPTYVATTKTFFAVDAGDDFTCAISTQAAPYCWGAGNDGQLGTGSSGSTTPVLVAGF